MLAEKAEFPVKLMARVLGVSRSGFYSWLSNGCPQDDWSCGREAVRRVWLESDRRFGLNASATENPRRRPSGASSATSPARCSGRFANPLEIKGPSWKDLRPARQALGITLVEAGKAPNVGFQRVSYAETGRLMSVRFLEEYDAWLKSQTKKAS